MATRSSILAWKIPWTEKPGRLQSMGLQRLEHDPVTDHAHTHTHSVLSLFVYNFISHSLFNIISLNLHKSSMRLVSFYPFYV